MAPTFASSTRGPGLVVVGVGSDSLGAPAAPLQGAAALGRPSCATARNPGQWVRRQEVPHECHLRGTAMLICLGQGVRESQASAGAAHTKGHVRLPAPARQLHMPPPYHR